MSKTVIQVDSLWKEYRLGAINHQTLTCDLQSWWARIRGKEDPNSPLGSPSRPFTLHSSQDDNNDRFWALQNVSFEVKQGDILGIIGRNGAGKSTLLKILSQVTAPSKGEVRIKGRIASLLEVGTGFHPELTGRENIFLNGAILGMSKADVRKNLDKIVAFAEVEKFVDTPVKRYSSGMYVRLAFAVAAHLESEILIVDEVLAVGDTIFQKKCIDKMLEVGSQGRTVLFVSHNFSAVKALCRNAMLLRNGQFVFSGGVQEAIEKYTEEIHLSGSEIDLLFVDRKKTAQELVFEKITFLNYPVRFGETISFKLKLKSTGSRSIFSEIDFGIALRDKNQNTVVHLSNRYLDLNIEHVSDDTEYLFQFENIIKPDVYSLTLFLRTSGVIQDWLSNIVRIEIADGNPYGFHDTKQIQGVVLPEFMITVIRKM